MTIYKSFAIAIAIARIGSQQDSMAFVKDVKVVIKHEVGSIGINLGLVVVEGVPFDVVVSC